MTNQNQEQAIVLRAEFADVYLKTYDGQYMRPVKARMTLSERRGHFYEVKGKKALAAPAYFQMNKVASVSLVTPLKVIVDGREEGNPFVKRDPETEAIKSVAIRRMGIGFSPIGNIVAIDKTLFYNVYTYLIQSLQSKMKKDKRKSPCAFVGMESDKPKSGKWVFWKTIPPLGIWANYEDQYILDVLEEHTQRQRFGDRIAQTVVDRNILKDHPAIAITRPDIAKGQAVVTVYGWRHELTPNQVNDIMAQAAAGAEQIEVKKEDLKEVPIEEEQAVIDVEEPEQEEEPEVEEEAAPEPTAPPKTGGKFDDEPPDSHFEKEKKEEEKKAKPKKQEPPLFKGDNRSA